MASTHVFFAGGSGCKIMQAFYYAAAANPEMLVGKRVIPYLLETATTAPDYLKAQIIADLYDNLHKKSDKAGDVFFSANIAKPQKIDISSFFNNNLGNATVPNKMTLLDYLDEGKQDLNALTTSDTLFDYELLTLLFDDSPATLPIQNNVELHLPLTDGIYGKPHIGTSIFSAIGNTQIFQSLKSNAFNATQDNILIVASIFGGTGSSALPAIVDGIRQTTSSDIQRCKIGLVLVLPYFDLSVNNNNRINADLFYLKTQVALEYYQKTIYPKVDRVYTIGERPASIAFNNDPSGSGQQNAPHVLELLAAYQAIHFISTASTITGNDNDKANLNQNHFQFGRSKQIVAPTAKVQNVNVEPPSNQNDLTLNYFYSQGTGAAFWTHFAAFSLCLKYYEQNFARDERESVVYYDRLFKQENPVSKQKTTVLDPNFTTNLTAFVNEYKLWLTGLGKKGDGAGYHNKPFVPFNWDKENKDLGFFINGYNIPDFNERVEVSGFWPFKSQTMVRKLLSKLTDITNMTDLANKNMTREAKFLQLFHNTFTTLLKEYPLILQQ